MRTILFEKIHKAMRERKNIFFLTAGVGFNLVEPMFAEFPTRTQNVGIAEQNLVGIAAGLSNVGFKVICYSYTNFLAERALEQIRNDICLHRYAPILLGTTTGFDNAGLGATHHALDDIGVLKSLPHISIFSPSSNESMAAVIETALDSSEASFIRFTKSEFAEGKPVTHINRFLIRNTSPILIISHGKMAHASRDAAKIADVCVFAMDKLKPLDEQTTKNLLSKYSHIVVVEDNFKSGLFNSLCEFAALHGLTPRLHSLSPREEYIGEIGDAGYFEDRHGLTPEKISAFCNTLSSC
ncbi:MAG: hypothetical protein HYS59_01205 [Candidatus Vogelbacteria bacterium]|nr:hypothetical protein [Candidatus Vogelbacteria bacterium]